MVLGVGHAESLRRFHDCYGHNPTRVPHPQAARCSGSSACPGLTT